MSMCFVYASSALEAGAFAKRQGWHPAGRSAWQTRDGVMILFLCFLEQLEAVTDGATVFDAGMCREATVEAPPRHDPQMTRRFPPPWTVETIAGGFKVRDATGQALAYVYARENEASAQAAKVLTEARRIAANIAKLPDLLSQ